MCEPSNAIKYKSGSELFCSPTTTTIVDDVRAQLERDRDESPLDQVRLREQEDWNFLASKIVGSENIQ